MELRIMMDAVAEYRKPLKLELRLVRAHADASLWARINSYIAEYCAHYQLAPSAYAAALDKFINRYRSDLQNFVSSAKYPYELLPDGFTLSRQEYDCFLMASFLFTKHRYALAAWLAAMPPVKGKTIFIGVGSGLELLLVPGADGNPAVHAYDLELSSFVRQRFGIHMHDDIFYGQERQCERIFCIELLEHLDHPAELLTTIHASLQPGGVLVATAACNVPQFDHRYNFKCGELSHLCQSVGFAPEQVFEIPHNYLFLQNIQARYEAGIFRKR